MSRLYCARCDKGVPEGADSCRWDGSKAFYRGRPPLRHLMGTAEPEPEIVAEAPYPARSTKLGLTGQVAFINRRMRRGD